MKTLLEEFIDFNEDENCVNYFDESYKLEKLINENDNSKDNNKVKDTNKLKEFSKFAMSYKNLDDANLEKNIVGRKLIRYGVSLAATIGAFKLDPVVGLVTAMTSVCLTNKSNLKERKKLCDLYKDKIRYLDDKISKEDDDEKKYKLTRLKTEMENNLRKVEVFNTKHSNND